MVHFDLPQEFYRDIASWSRNWWLCLSVGSLDKPEIKRKVVNNAYRYSETQA
jgi:hypothetical protein